MDASGERPQSLESLIGKAVRRLWIDAQEVIIDFEDGITLQIEAEDGELRAYLGFVE